MILRFLSRPIYGALTVFLAAFFLYLRTLAPGVGFIDAGELATVAKTLGIAHPTGYPLYTLLGHLFSILPIASTVILRLNIMSAFFAALGSGAIVFLGYEIHRSWIEERNSNSKGTQLISGSNNETIEHQSVAAGIVCALIMAFSRTWWGTATSVEVYPIHQFFLPVVIIFFLRFLRTDSLKEGMLFALTLGLSFSNHLTTVLLAPAFLYAYFARFGFRMAAFKRIAALTAPFIIGLSPYLYLPLRSASFPLLDWGHPANISSFLKHVTGGQYKVWMFTEGAAAKQWSYFWSGLAHEFDWVTLSVLLLSLTALFRIRSVKSVHIGIFLVLLFAGCLLYAIQYDIHDIDSYFLLSYLSIGLISSIVFSKKAGMLKKIMTDKIRSYASLILFSAVILGSIGLLSHYNDSDESDNYMVDDFTHNMLINLPKDAIILSTAWDFWVSGSLYYQFVEGLRPDVTVIDIALLRDRPWYYEHLRQTAPDIFDGCKKELDDFYKQLVIFDKGEPYDGTAISASYRAFTEALLRTNQHRPIFITSESIADRDQLFAPTFKPRPAHIFRSCIPYGRA